MADSFDHCEALVRAGDKDRFLATLFAPQKHRRALHALYAFNLEISRVRELAREPMPGEIRLQWWRDVLGGIGRGDVDAHPVAAALRDVTVRYSLPPRMLVAMIDARAFDLYNEPMQSIQELERYTAGTASTLIELAARVLRDGRNGGIDPPLASHAGIAYAIAGLMRALPVHVARGQLYLPADVMNRHGAQATDVLAGQTTTELRAALAEMRLRARQHLAAARNLLDAVPAEVIPALLPLAVVKPALDRMERRNYQPFMPADVPQWRKQWAIWRAARSDLQRAF